MDEDRMDEVVANILYHNMPIGKVVTAIKAVILKVNETSEEYKPDDGWHILRIQTEQCIGTVDYCVHRTVAYVVQLSDSE